jgi:uncharacterized protein YkwD
MRLERHGRGLNPQTPGFSSLVETPGVFAFGCNSMVNPVLLAVWITLLLVATSVRTSSAQTSGEREVETFSTKVETFSTKDVGPFRPEHTPDVTKARRLLVEQTNAFRKSERRDVLDRNQRLDAAAQEFARHMAKTDRYGHTADGRSFHDRAERHGYEYCLISENIAYQFATEGFTTDKLAQQFVQGWIKSPGHRDNMLKEHATEIGVGIAGSDATGIYYAVQLFGRPRSAAITFVVENETSQSVQYAVGERHFTLPARFHREHQLCVPASLQLVSREDADAAQEGDAPDGGAAIHPQQGVRYRVTLTDGRPVLLKGD